MNRYLAIDIGGTFIKYGEYLEDGTELTNEKISTPQNAEAFLDELVNIISNHKEISGVGISTPGFINPLTGENTDFTIRESLKKFNLKLELSKRTNLNVSVENDANCASLAESWIGAGKDHRNIVVVTLGTGVGGGIIIDKDIYRGGNFKAGEFGLMVIGRDDSGYITPPSTSKLVKMVSQAIGKEVTGEYIFENYHNEQIKKVYELWLERVAITLGNLAVSYDAEMVLVGGGISGSDIFVNDLKNKVYSIFSHLKGYTVIDRCLLKNNAGKLGALYNHLKEYKR